MNRVMGKDGMKKNLDNRAMSTDLDEAAIVSDLGDMENESVWSERYFTLLIERDRLVERVLLDAEVADKMNQRILQIYTSIQSIIDRDSEFAQLLLDMKQKENEFAQLLLDMKQKENEFAHLFVDIRQAFAAKQDEDTELLHEYKAQLKEQYAKVDQLQICNLQLTKQFAEAQEKTAISQHQIEQLQNDLTKLKNSTSWRVTKFLRVIKDIVSSKR